MSSFLRSLQCNRVGARLPRVQVMLRSAFRSSTTSNQKAAIPLDFERDVEIELSTDASWAKSKSAMDTIQSGKREPVEHITANNMSEYLLARGYSTVTSDASALRVLSSLCTNPLSLAYALQSLSAFERKQTNILLVGARAEANLPSIWWREYLYMCSRAPSTSIKMIGPGMLKNAPSAPKLSGKYNFKWSSFKPKQDALSPSQAMTSSTSSPEINVITECTKESVKLLHDSSEVLQLLQWADVFALLNPGIGSKSCSAQWDPTIRLLLQTKKPIIGTAFGEQDLKNDLEFLDRISSEEDHEDFGEPVEFLFPPHENPFRSHRRTIDKDAEMDTPARIVTTNRFIYALQAK